MCDRRLTKTVLALAAVVGLPLSSLLAQEMPKSGDDSFDIEPPLLVQPAELKRASDESQENAPEAQPDAGNLAQQLEGAKKSAASAARLVKIGVLSKVEAEQRALRVVRLDSELAKAQMIAAQEQLTSQKACFAARQASQPEVNAASAAWVRAAAAAQSAEENSQRRSSTPRRSTFVANGNCLRSEARASPTPLAPKKNSRSSSRKTERRADPGTRSDSNALSIRVN